MTYDPAPSWQTVMEGAEAGVIDVLPAITPSPERARFLDFTKPYLHFPFVIFTRKDASLITGIGDLSAARVAVERGYVTQEYLRRDHPQLRLHPVDTTAQALRALTLGKVDAYTGNLTLGSYLIDKLSLGNLKVAAPTPYANDLAMGGAQGLAGADRDPGQGPGRHRRGSAARHPAEIARHPIRYGCGLFP